MAESKSTPGPWVIRPREIMEDGSVYPMSIEGGQLLTHVCMLETTYFAEAVSKDPAQFPVAQTAHHANARLIAAAPSLLEALQATVALADANRARWEKEEGRLVVRSLEMQAAYDRCAAAIALATKES